MSGVVVTDPRQLDTVPRAVAIGSFDGVHRGHRRVLDVALGSGLRPTAITFDPHPRAHFGQPVRLLCSLERRVELLHAAGVREVLVLPFTAATAGLSPAAWIEQVLRPIGARLIAVGPDFRFGHRRTGDVRTLRGHGLTVPAVPLLPGVSSTRIRLLIGAGRLDEAAALLGRPVEGEVAPHSLVAERAA